MTVYREHTVWCNNEKRYGSSDAPGDACVEFAHSDERTKAKARADVARFGWTVRNGRDFCPACSPDQSSASNEEG